MNILFKNRVSDHLFSELQLKYKHERKTIKKVAYLHLIFLNNIALCALWECHENKRE